MIASPPPVQGNFVGNTRLKQTQLPTLTKGTGANTQSLQLPKTGLLAALYLQISATVAGTLSAPNAQGAASIISRVRLTLNSGIDLINVSGPGYHYLLRDMLDSEYVDVCVGSTARNAVSATTFDLSMYFPIAINPRDPIGLLLLQNEQTIATLAVDFLADTSVATGATVTCTVKPYIDIFTVPDDPANLPPLNLLHGFLEDQQAVSGAGDFAYTWPRGNVYAQIAHGLGMAQSGSDKSSLTRVVINQTDNILYLDANGFDRHVQQTRGRARLAGTYPIDFMGSSGLGSFGSMRDFFNSNQVTQIQTILTATGADTLYTIRRQLFPLASGV